MAAQLLPRLRIRVYTAVNVRSDRNAHNTWCICASAMVQQEQRLSNRGSSFPSSKVDYLLVGIRSPPFGCLLEYDDILKLVTWFIDLGPGDWLAVDGGKEQVARPDRPSTEWSCPISSLPASRDRSLRCGIARSATTCMRRGVPRRCGALRKHDRLCRSAAPRGYRNSDATLWLCDAPHRPVELSLEFGAAVLGRFRPELRSYSLVPAHRLFAMPSTPEASPWPFTRAGRGLRSSAHSSRRAAG